MTETCIYCNNSRSSKLTVEHSISKAVFEVLFYPLKHIGTRSRSEIYGDKTLINTMPSVKDVCMKCNSDLHKYDEAGKHFAKSISPFADITGIQIPFNEKILGWLIKTHLNCIRSFPNLETRKKYVINRSILNAIINYTPIPDGLYKLYIEGWQGVDYLWDDASTKRIQIMNFISVELLRQKILVSDLRIKTLRTFLLLPADSDYTDFEDRTKSAFDEMKNFYGFHIEQIAVKKAIQDGYIYAHEIMPLTDILDRIKK